MKKLLSSENLVKKLGALVVGFVFVFYSFILFLRAQYGLSTLLVLSLIPLLKLDALEELAFSFSEGLRAKFRTPAPKVEENIKENKEPVTNRNFARFRHIESKILADYQKRYGGEMKTLIHYVYGQPDKPQFTYTPDATIQTEKELIFFEIKYILKPELAKSIVDKTLKYLSEVYSKFLPSIGSKRFVIKFILASGYDLSKMSFKVPKGIEIEHYKL